MFYCCNKNFCKKNEHEEFLKMAIDFYKKHLVFALDDYKQDRALMISEQKEVLDSKACQIGDRLYSRVKTYLKEIGILN